MADLPLLAVPNVSEGRGTRAVEAIVDRFQRGGRARVLDVHSDRDHDRSVMTLAGSQRELPEALLEGASAAIERIDVMGGKRVPGVHPHVGAVDVMPIVYLGAEQRGAACATALVIGHEIGAQLRVPVFLYGELADGRTRAELRRGGVEGLRERIERDGLSPDFGPRELHRTAGAMLVAAREPLVAFNLELAPPADLARAREIASTIREGGEQGLKGVRAIGVAAGPLQGRREPGEKRLGESATGQVSMNVEHPLETRLCAILEIVQAHARVACAEIVGLVPSAALEGFPEDVELVGFDPDRQLIERAATTPVGS